MIIIPELKKVVILVPRTGTRSLKNAVLRRYPKSFLLYRHMEADGVPHGYDRWEKIGVVRDPIARLWSLYKYLKNFGIDWAADHDQAYTQKMRDSVSAPFEDWLMGNKEVFTSPYDSAGYGRFWPEYAVLHPLPENQKSQFHYLRPDLGTQIFKYTPYNADIYDFLDLPDPVTTTHRENQTPPQQYELVRTSAKAYARKWFEWDYNYLGL